MLYYRNNCNHYTSNKPRKGQSEMAKVNVKPLGDRVLLELCEVAEQIKGGIIIPDAAKETQEGQ